MKLKGEINLNRYFIFRFNIFLQSFALVCIVLFTALGMWQINRANLKQSLEEDYLNFLSDKSPPQLLNSMAQNLSLNELSELPNYSKIKIKGTYDFSKQIIRDNRFYNNQVGFFVFTPFILENTNIAILVNRGWVAMGENRSAFREKIAPNSEWIKKNNTIEAFIYQPLNRFEIADYPLGNWPVIVQNLDYQKLKPYFDYELIETTARLLVTEQMGYIRDWKFQTATPKQKHQAYALQWFSFALIAFMILIYKSFTLSKKN